MKGKTSPRDGLMKGNKYYMGKHNLRTNIQQVTNNTEESMSQDHYKQREQKTRETIAQGDKIKGGKQKQGE